MLLLIRIFSRFPLTLLYVLSDYVIYPIVRYVLRYRLKLVRKNIHLSFPDKTPSEQQKIINDFYHHFADLLVEIIYGYRTSDEEMRQRVFFDNVEMLEELVHKKHGVIIYLGHICNWEWMADIGKRFNNKSIVEYNVYRKQKNTHANHAMLELRKKRGGKCIDKNSLLRKLVELRHADHPFSIGLIADQKPSPRSGHIWTTFLNQETAFLNGGEMLARKFDLGVVYACITSPQRGYYRIHFELITGTPNNMPQDSITLAYASFLEQNIHLQPHVWLWTHNRWKWKRDISS